MFLVRVLVFAAVVVLAVLASVYAFAGASEILGDEEIDEEGGLAKAIGWYFLAKGFFLGPMLALVGFKVLLNGRSPDGRATD